MADTLSLSSLSADQAEFAQDIVEGLSKDQKTLPSKWLYDAEGSRLYDEITELPEYYPTRTETKILEQSAHELAADIGENAVLIEYGPGLTDKTLLLIGALNAPACYVPIDVSERFLDAISKHVHGTFPKLAVEPVTADFTRPIEGLPGACEGPHRVGFFSGSTIGNFSDAEIDQFLASARQTLGDDGLFVVGYDLRKPASILVPAYDDAQGVTAAFNLNLLERINREFGEVFETAAFRHKAVWNDAESRIEMHLVSQEAQEIDFLDQAFRFERGETIHTENSRKFSQADIETRFRKNGWRPVKTLTDDKGYFAVALLEAVSAEQPE